MHDRCSVNNVYYRIGMHLLIMHITVKDTENEVFVFSIVYVNEMCSVIVKYWLKEDSRIVITDFFLNEKSVF